MDELSVLGYFYTLQNKKWREREVLLCAAAAFIRALSVRAHLSSVAPLFSRPGSTRRMTNPTFLNVN